MELRATSHDKFKYTVTQINNSENYLFKITNWEEIDPSILNHNSSKNGTDYTLNYYCTPNIGTGLWKYEENKCTDEECWIDPGFSDEKMWIKWETKEMKMEVIRLIAESKKLKCIKDTFTIEMNKHINQIFGLESESDKVIVEFSESIKTEINKCIKKYKQQKEINNVE
jgi:hypothetical protein